MLSEARSELSYRDEALLWGYAGGLENRPDYNWDRFWPTREKILQFLGELRLLHNLRMIPDCDLVWALSSSGINTYSLAKQQCDSYKTYVDLVNPLVLPAIDGDSKIKPIVIKLPSDVRLNRFPTGTDFSWTRTGSIADGMIRLLPHYFNALVGDPYDAFVITNGCSSECVAKWARAKTFTVQLRRCLDAAGQGVNCTGSFASEDIRTYSITLPVNLGIHAESDYHGSTLTWRYPRMSVGLDELIYASGGDTSVSGNMTWSTDPVLPAGLGLLDSPVRNGQNLQVDLSEGARSYVGDLKLEQAGQIVARPMEIEVPVHFLGSDWVGFVVLLDRGDTNVNRNLPQPYGGDGNNYTWTLRPLPPEDTQLGDDLGLTLTSDGRLTGDVLSNAPLDTHEFEVTVSSTIGLSRSPTIYVRVRTPPPPPPPLAGLRFEDEDGRGGLPKGTELTGDVIVSQPGAKKIVWICAVHQPPSSIQVEVTPHPSTAPLVVYVAGENSGGTSTHVINPATSSLTV